MDSMKLNLWIHRIAFTVFLLAAASAREAKTKLRSREYHMIITDMRMENEAAGTDVIQAARSAPYHPAVALLTAFPVDEEGWDGVEESSVGNSYFPVTKSPLVRMLRRRRYGYKRQWCALVLPGLFRIQH